MNQYDVKIDEDYSALLRVDADFYSIDGLSLDFYMYNEEGATERVASFRSTEWVFVKKVEDVEDE